MKKFSLISMVAVGLFLSLPALAGTFIDWTSSSTEAVISTIKDLISDLTPLLVIIIPILLGLVIFEVIVSVMRGRH